MLCEVNMQENLKLNYLQNNLDWDFELLEYFDKQIQSLAINYGLDTYPNQIEIITSAQMLEACSNLGLPVNYNHWSFGKHYINLENNYKKGSIGLAYELVINSNPCISYLMEENTLALQITIIAHACYGHNSFFKSNYLFKTWTSPDKIVDFMASTKKYLMQCEEQYGFDTVEEVLDACQALKNYAIDTYKRNPTQRPQVYPEENILYYIEHNSKFLEPWKKNIINLMRTINQYFYPQLQTKVMNEGWATFWHYTLINDLYTQGIINDDIMLEFLHLHTEVIKQPAFDSPEYTGINPYNLGFRIFEDIRRICESPTEEDKEWFPNLVNTNWLESIDFAMRNFKDESFITQYLSPKVIRDLRLFAITNCNDAAHLKICEIHDEIGYKKIRELLSQQYDRRRIEPNIQVQGVTDDGILELANISYPFVNLDPEQDAVLKHLCRLWGNGVRLQKLDATTNTLNFTQYPPNDINCNTNDV